MSDIAGIRNIEWINWKAGNFELRNHFSGLHVCRKTFIAVCH